MKSGMTRWKIVPSYRRSLDFLRVEGCVHSRLPSASSTKLATVLGASFSKRRHTMLPSLVSNVAYSPACRVMESFQSLVVLGPMWGEPLSAVQPGGARRFEKCARLLRLRCAG